MHTQLQINLCLSKLFLEDELWVWWHWPIKCMWCGERGPLTSLLASLVSLSASLPFPHIYLPYCSHSKKLGHPPDNITPTTPVHVSPCRPLFPFPPLWKGERMLSPHKSPSLLVLQERGSSHREAPSFTYTKGRVKRKNRRKKRAGTKGR